MHFTYSCIREKTPLHSYTLLFQWRSRYHMLVGPGIVSQNMLWPLTTGNS